jgi:hypothetical protein
MEQLIQELVSKAGLNNDQAQKAVEIIKEYIMGNVPPMFSEYVENFFKNKEGETGTNPVQDIMGKFGL